jgi:hypothetical protein
MPIANGDEIFRYAQDDEGAMTVRPGIGALLAAADGEG